MARDLSLPASIPQPRAQTQSRYVVGGTWDRMEISVTQGGLGLNCGMPPKKFGHPGLEQTILLHVREQKNKTICTLPVELKKETCFKYHIISIRS